jgi:hypothetical protein
VDDLLLALPAEWPAEPNALPEVVAIVAGPLALEANLSRPLRAIARGLYRVLGLRDPRPVELPWSCVTHIDVLVHADFDRESSGAMALAEAVCRRFIARLPGA